VIFLEPIAVLLENSIVAGSIRVEDGLIKHFGVGYAFILRDFVAVWSLESHILDSDLHFLQPVDVWVRSTAQFLWPNLSKSTRKGLKEAPDWFLAQYVTKKCLKHKVSSIRCNQGAWLFGSEQVKESSQLPAALSELASRRREQ
jgi:hypothetical protein